MARNLRVLFLSDTHLGLPGFFEPYACALEPALRGEVDLVIHGGDMFYRSKVEASVVSEAFEPLKRIASSGVPVVIVPGNHERSAIPYPLLAAHPGIHIFNGPSTFRLNVAGIRVAIVGFPNDRDHIAERFGDLLARSNWQEDSDDVRLLCIHQSVEGATVGPVDFTFRRAPDVIPGSAIPSGFAAVLSGHIHRHQVLRKDLQRRQLAAPVFYPGSTSRTSSAEDFDEKGYLTMQFEPDARSGGRVFSWLFHELDGGAYIDNVMR